MQPIDPQTTMPIDPASLGQCNGQRCSRSTVAMVALPDHNAMFPILKNGKVYVPMLPTPKAKGVTFFTSFASTHGSGYSTL
jgi:hypothetical protein